MPGTRGSTLPGCVPFATCTCLALRCSQAALEAGGVLSKADALALASANLEKLLGVKADSLQGDLVVTRGGDLLEFSKVVAVISPRRGVVDIL